MVALHLSDNPHQLPEADIREPITAVISRVVRPGKEAAYEAWAEGITRACADFDGYMGTDFIRPADHAHPEYVTIFRFDSYPHLRDWQESEAVRDWLDRVGPLIVRESELRLQQGLEVWFTQAQQLSPSQPHIVKISLVTWIALTPLVLLVPPVLMPYLGWMPEALAVTLVTGVNVAFMAYPVMPLMTHLFRKWLYPTQ